jgi:penicillin-binding protein 1A
VLVLGGVPAGLLPDSVSALGRARTQVTIGSVELRQATFDATPFNRRRATPPDSYLVGAFEFISGLASEGRLGNDRVLIVKTPLDLAVQHQAEQTLEDMLRQYGRQYDVDQGAVVVMDVDGAVRAMVGGRDYGQSQFNRATDALRQPGSSFKPFVYAAALTTDPKLRPTSTVVDRQICLGNWCPHNYSRSFAGAMPLVSALARSINSIPVQLSVEIGKGRAKDNNAAKAGRAIITDLAMKMGLTHPLADSSSLPIGAAEVTVIDMTSSYAVFANGGKKATPFASSEIRNSQGETIYRHDRDAPQPQVLEPRVVSDMNFMMNKVVEEGTGRRARIDGVQVAGKTGTTNAYRDAWFVGFTGNLAAGVWFGNDDHTSMKNMTGGTLPAQTWHDIMAFAHQNLELRPLPGLELAPGAKVAFASARSPSSSANGPSASAPLSPGTLSRRSYEAVGAIGTLFQRLSGPDAGTSSVTPPRASVSGARVAMP